MSTQRSYWASLPLYLPLLLFPIFLFRFSLGPLPLNGLDLLLILAICWRLPDLRRVSRTSPLFKFALLFLLVGLLSTIIADDPRTALGSFKSWYILPILYTLTLSTQKFSWKIARLCLLAGYLTVMIYGLIILPHDSGHRLRSWYESPNYVAMAGEVLLFLTFPEVIAAWGGWQKRKEFFSLAVISAWLFCLIAFFLTFSIGGIGALIAGGLAYLLSRAQRKTLLITFWLLITLAMIGLTGLGVPKNHITGFGQRSGSIESRRQIWTTTYAILKEHPLTGVGLRQYEAAYRSHIHAVVADPVEPFVLFPHNLFLSLWVTSGLLGLLAYALTLSWMLRQHLGQTSYTHWAVTAALTALLTHGLIDTPHFFNDLNLFFWLMILMSVQQMATPKIVVATPD